MNLKLNVRYILALIIMLLLALFIRMVVFPYCSLSIPSVYFTILGIIVLFTFSHMFLVLRSQLSPIWKNTITSSKEKLLLYCIMFVILIWGFHQDKINTNQFSDLFYAMLFLFIGRLLSPILERIYYKEKS